MIPVDDAALGDLAQRAAESPRGRAHLLLHQDHADPVQRLLILANPGTYVRVHRHTAQWEVLALLRGAADILMLSQDGRLEKRLRLGAGQLPLVQIAPGTAHGAVVLEPETLLLEIKPGPYRPNEFLDWAPPEGDAEAARFLLWSAQAEAGEMWRM